MDLAIRMARISLPRCRLGNVSNFCRLDPCPATDGYLTSVRLGDKVRVRIGNLTMTNHPIHLHGHSFAVSCTDGGWVPESAQWPEKDEEVRFILRNSGELDHEFVLAATAENLKHAESMNKNPDMEHDDPNAMELGPKKTGDLLWKFSKAGEFEYACLIPGHREARMIGTILVK